MQLDQAKEENVEVRRRRLSESKLRLLEARMRGVVATAQEHRVPPRTPEARVPLSPEQRRLWLHASQHPEIPVYNEPFTLYRFGTLDIGILAAALGEVVRRHEAWRTSFSPEGEQIVHPPIPLNLDLSDLTRLPEAEREAEALRLATQDAQEPIRLDQVPLFRTRVVRLKEDEHRLYLTFHHIIFDGISISRTFVPELTAIYAALEHGQACSLPAPRLQYGDYALWRERHVESPQVQQHLAWWKTQLSGELPVLRLPEDRPRPAVASHRGSMECFEIPPALLEQLRRLSRAREATLYMSLLAAWQVLLFRYSGQNDLIVGSAADGRRCPELEGVIGYFIDTFAVRTRPLARISFAEYLAQTREAVLGGLAAADVPFDLVVREINPPRDPGLHPIFQTFFSMRPRMSAPTGGWKLSQTDVTVGTTKFDLYLELGEWPGGMEARIFYSTDIWHAETIRRMAAHFCVLLGSITRNPDEELGNLELLTAEETAEMLGPGGWNDTARAVPALTLSALVEEQCRRTPDSLAARFGQERWTYRELDARAELLANDLRAAGVKRGSIVAVGLERSLDLLAGLLAVLKTGAAYLPLDVEMPRERVLVCLQDAKPSAVVTQSSLSEHVSFALTPAVLIDANRAATSPTSADTVLTGNPDDTAYVIYTSGTTGEPKGVEISQRSLVNLLESMRSAPGFNPNDICLAVTPVSFDIAALELFLPLICGGMVVIASREEARDPFLLAKAISRSRCTFMQATPATWRALLLSGWTGRQRPDGHSEPRMRILCGGESLPRNLADGLLATGAELWNMYGPTETTIWSTINRVSRVAETETASVPVGLPIANTTALVLDPQFRLLPVGIPGELFLGGAGLAKGYRGQPGRTAERFFTIAAARGDRMYRTGDLAMRHSDGTLEILGRTDNQVKVRGYRIELEAVEAMVSRHPRVAAVAARVWPDVTGDFRLSVYVVAKNGSAPNPADMRTFLARSVPDAMIPSDVIELSAIPLTPHGKVDRSRLPALHACEPPPARRLVCSPTELRVAAIWRDLLGRKHIGPEDNFFEMGGHSVLIVALQHRLATEFHQTIPVAELFQNPTVRQQARLTERLPGLHRKLPPGVVNTQPGGTGQSIFWVHYLRGDLAQAIGDDQPFFSVALTAEDFAGLSESPTLESIAACLTNKILATQPGGPRVIGGHCAWGILAFEVASQLRAAGHEVSLLVLIDSPNPCYVASRDLLSRQLGYVPYCAKRIAKLGFRASLIDLGRRLAKPVARARGSASCRTEMRVAQDIVEAAARCYEPNKYDGSVLLLLASERPPHIDLRAGWQAVVPVGLHTHYIYAHHFDFSSPRNLATIGDVIASYLTRLNNEPSSNLNEVSLSRPVSS